MMSPLYINNKCVLLDSPVHECPFSAHLLLTLMLMMSILSLLILDNVELTCIFLMDCDELICLI